MSAITKSKSNWAALTKSRASKVLTIGHTGDVELVRHTYATSGGADELERLVSNYLDDCECDYDYEEVEQAVDGLLDEGHSRIGDHFFRLTELETA